VTQQYFPGVIDDIRIYNRALSSNEVAQLYAIESTPPRGDTSLVAWWKANGDATDSAGTNNAAMHGVTFAPGISGQAFALPECDAPPCNTGFLTAPQNDAWNFGTNDFSILLWANFAQTTTTASSDQALLSHDDMNSTKWIFWLHQGNTLGFHTEDGPGAPLMFPISQSFTPTVGQWYCLALTRNWETKTYSLWVNGQVIGQTIGDTNAVPSANAPLYIGQAENSNPVYGELENIYVFSRALSANDVQYLYENPGASPLPQTPPAGFQTNGLVAYYPFNGNANDASVVYHK